MDIKRFKTFVAVAEHGTVSKASEVLHVTQPALSRQISDLEHEVGFRLFDRVGRRMLLTVRGEQILADCRSILAGVDTLAARAKALATGDLKVLWVAASALTIEAMMPLFMRRHAEIFPDVRLSVIEADAARHIGMLERGEAHFAVGVLNAIHTNEHIVISGEMPSFEIVAAHAPSFDIKPAETIDIAQLCQHPLLLLDESYATRNVFSAACRIADVQPNIFLESGSTHALLALAEAGHGIAVLPSILRVEPGLRVMRVTHRREPLVLKVGVLWDGRRTLPRYAKEFLELFAACMRESFPAAPPASRPKIRLVSRG